ncbi:MAG: LppX_LprAFG lipoprotein [Candidatus Dormibacterales bacterium]
MAMRRAISCLAVCLVLAGCGSSSQPASIDPVQLLRDSGAAMGSLKTVSATLKFTKGSVSFQGFTLVSAKTAVRLPADSDTTYTVKEQDFTVALEVVITGGHVYLQVPFSALHEETGATAAALPDLAKLFDPSTGLPAVIPAGRNAKDSGEDSVDGVSTHVVDATYTADQVHGMLAQVSSTGDIQARIWIGEADHLIRRATLDGAFGDGGKESAIEVDISGFNAAVSITSPSP